MANSTVAEINNSGFFIEAFDGWEFRMGMPYSFIRILDSSQAVYMEFPGLRFYPGLSASDFVGGFDRGLLTLQVLLTKEEKYLSLPVKIDLIKKLSLIDYGKYSSDGFKPIDVMLNGIKVIQKNL